MRNLRNNYTVPEKFFVQRLDEQIHSKTIDSYRNRIHNPRTILHELKSIIQGLWHNTIKNEEHLKQVVAEAEQIVTETSGLEFKTISLKFFRALLSKLTKDKWGDLVYSINVILSENMNYSDKLFQVLEAEIIEVNINHEKYLNEDRDEKGEKITFTLDRIDKWTNYLTTELIHKGYSKTRLRQLCYKVLIKKRMPFLENFEHYKNAFNNGPERLFVLVKVKMTEAIIEEICNSHSKIKFVKEVDFTQRSIKQFIQSKSQFNACLQLEIVAVDYNTAAFDAVREVAALLDFINLGHRESNSEYFSHCLVIDDARDKVVGLDSRHHLDGLYRSDDELHKLINEKYQNIVSNDAIDKSVVDILKSGVRYLRLGDEDNEAEQKLLNYWIGIEHLFGFINDDQKIIQRISKSFSEIHYLSYYKRNIENFHTDIVHLGYSAKITGFDENNSDCLNDADILQQVIDVSATDDPLLAYRAYHFKKMVSDEKYFKNKINKHKLDVERNFYRLYRVRNNIVHNAAILNNLSELSSHLQYYLTFILTSILDYYNSERVDLNDDKKINILDYFIHHRLRHESLDKDELNAQNMIHFSNPLSAHLKAK